MPFWGGKVIASYSLPNFNEYFDLNSLTLINIEEKEKLISAINEFENHI